MRHSLLSSSHVRALLLVTLCLASCGSSNDEDDDSGNPANDVTPPVTNASPPGGAYSAAQTVKLTSNEPATIYYTLDGSVPVIGDPNTQSGPSPITGLAVNTSPTQITFFGVDTAGNEETVRTHAYIIDTTDPIVATVGPAPELFGLLTTQSIAWQSNENGTYRIQLGGNGAPNTGVLLEVGSVTALTQKTIALHGWQLTFGPAQPLWILVSDAATNVGTTSVDIELKGLETLPLNPATRGIAITPDGTSALISFFNAHELARYDIDPASPSFHTQTAGISIGFQPGDLAITPDGTRAYVGHLTGVDVIDTTSEAVQTIPLDVGDPIADIAITPDGTRAYFARSGILYVLDTDPSSPTFHDIPLQVAPNTPLFLSAHVAVTPDGKRLLVGWFGVVEYSLAVVDIDPASPTFHQVIATPVPVVGANSVAPSVSNDSQFAFVGNALGNMGRVALNVPPINIDLMNASISPDASLVTNDDAFLLILRRGSTALTIVEPDTLSIVGILTWQSLGDVGAITPDGQRAYLLRNAGLATQELVAVPLE